MALKGGRLVMPFGLKGLRGRGGTCVGVRESFGGSVGWSLLGWRRRHLRLVAWLQRRLEQGHFTIGKV